MTIKLFGLIMAMATTVMAAEEDTIWSLEYFMNLLGEGSNEEFDSKKEIPGYDTIPKQMSLKDDVFYSGYYPVDNESG